MDSIQEKLALWRGLLGHEAWQEMVKMMQEQKDSRIQQVMLMPLESQDRIFEQEFVKGEFAAFALMMTLPDTMVETLEIELKKQQKDED